MTSELGGPDLNIIGNPPRLNRFTRYFPEGEPEPPPPPVTVATRPWFGSSAPEGLTGFNRLQTQIVGRNLELRTVFSSSFNINPTSLLMPDIAAGRVPSYSTKPPTSESQWDEFAGNIAALPGFVLLTVNHEPENDSGMTAAIFEDNFSTMYSHVKPIAGDNCWMGPVYMTATATNTSRQAYRDLLDTMDFDLIQVDGYNQLYRRSFAQLFNWIALKARSRTDLNTDPTIAGVPWAVREFSVHGTPTQRANWVNSARIYWEDPANKDLIAVNWFDSEEGDNAAIVGWRMEKALPEGWYPQELPGKPPGKLYARSKPADWAVGIEYIEDLATPTAVRNLLSTPRRALGPVVPPPVPPPPPPDYGALALGETNYQVPTDLTLVRFCSPSGSDTGAGTEANPYKTLQKAVNECPQDGTVVMRGGDYPESVTGKWNTRMTIQAYPGEAVRLMGSNVVTGWIQDNTGPGGINRWRKNNWTTEFDETPATPAIIDPAHPESVRPYQVWIDDVPLQQVNSLADVDATAPDEIGSTGTFWQDTTNNVLWVGTTPFNKTVRVAVRQIAYSSPQSLQLGSPRVDLKGIGVFHYATSSNQLGAVRMHGPSSVMENVIVDGCSASGVFFNQAEACKMINCTIVRCGQIGVRGYISRYFELQHCDIQFNNRKFFQTTQAAGGVKFDSYSHGFRGFYNRVQANYGHGIWMDIGSHLSAFWRNEFRDHTIQSGLFIENCSGTTIFGNYFRGNSIGNLFSESANAEVWNNTFVDNTYHIRIQYGTHEALPLAERFTQENFNMKNNVFAQYIADNNVRFLHTRDLHGGTRDIDETNVQIDYSAGYRASPGTSKYADVLLAGGQTTYATQDDFQSGTGREVNGIWDDTPPDPHLQADKSTPVAAGPLIETGYAPVPTFVSTNLEWSTEEIATPNRGWI